MELKNRVLTLTVFCFMGCIAIGAFVGTVEGKGILEDTELELSSDITINSNYIWRGIKLDGDPVMQSGLYLSGYGFDLSIWGSTDMDGDDTLSSEEVDYQIGYTYSISDTPLSITGGYIYYDFPVGDSASKEFYFGIALDVFLSPGFTWYHDFADEESGGGSGDYLVAELSHSIPISDLPVTFDMSGHVGYNDELFINGSGGDVELGAGLTIELTEKCSMSPSLNYSIPYGDLGDSNDGGESDKWYTGVTLAWDF